MKLGRDSGGASAEEHGGLCCSVMELVDTQIDPFDPSLPALDHPYSGAGHTEGHICEPHGHESPAEPN